MMISDTKLPATRVGRGRAHTLEAARLLRLLRFQSSPGNFFFPAHWSYLAMFDPDANDGHRLRACIGMLEPVRRAALREELSVCASACGKSKLPRRM